MAWEQINTIFPLGFMIDKNDNVLYNNDIIQNEIPVVSNVMYHQARNMTYRQEEWAWGKDGEFAIGVQFDLENSVPHVNGINPFNTYGSSMLYNYLTMNDIDVTELFEPYMTS